ncbi:FAD-binding oxidoreductase [Streptomyces sp. NA04227]|uniref:NAD(P)/FAD-dependent oxidoreductase n=1 Tax=Streptomyces sp. NA04227 TaxID=2742136 RepID=UPI0015900A8C|nr:FAD-dependent oxidoreductase [Streptomyces sp. NA04227]QKW06535.1 FAD-binding oxidoreductase [Streptomyces sp. NA04227]
MRGTRAVVIGAGIVGAACARELALAGFAVTVVDRGGAASATTAHGEGNILLSDKGPGPELELAKLSRRLWPEVLDAIAQRSRRAAELVRAVEWEPKGGIVVATTEPGAEALTAFAAGQRACGVRAETLDEDQLTAAEPFLTRDRRTALHYPEDAQVQPAAAATALLADALAEGAELRTGCEVLGARTGPTGLTGVHTSLGLLEAELFVNAAGPWAGALSARLGAPVDVRPRRGDVLVTTPLPPTVFHKVYDADYVGAVGSDDADLQTSAVVESTRGGSVLLGSSRRRVGFDDRLRPEVLAAVAAKALRLFPSLADIPVMRAYGGFRPYVPDHLPVLGADPRLAGLWHAGGHEGAGIGLALGTARLLRQLVLGRPTEIDPDPFRVDRPAVLAEAPPAEHPERPEHPEHPEHPENSKHSERPENSEHSEGREHP